jgi:3-methyl-2-oxobutanoate hydroxymethyltransferase
MAEKLTARDIVRRKAKGEKIAMITAYDYPTARLVDEAGVDIVLVGDSAAMVVLGLRDTRFIGMEEMLVFCRAVSSAVSKALVVGDMPFMSYQVSTEQAVTNAGRMVKEGGVDAVKLEGGAEYADVIKTIVRAGIPVMGHVGMTPQSAASSTGYRLRGKSAEDAERVIRDAEMVAKAGAFSIVLEFTTAEVAEYLSQMLEIPVIGVGAGPHCDGQVLVLHDVLGLYENSPPFAKKYADLRSVVLDAVSRYVSDVKKGAFPDEGRYWRMEERERVELKRRLERRNGKEG